MERRPKRTPEQIDQERQLVTEHLENFRRWEEAKGIAPLIPPVETVSPDEVESYGEVFQDISHIPKTPHEQAFDLWEQNWRATRSEPISGLRSDLGKEK